MLSKTKIEGMDKILKKLSMLKKSAATKVMRKGIAAGTKVVLSGAKARLPTKTKYLGKRSGLLRKSLGRKTKTYRQNGVVVGVVGPRKGFAKVIDGKRVDPVKYAHLVEGGRKAVKANKAKVLSDGKQVFGTKVAAVPPHPFMRPAIDEQKAGIKQAISKAAGEELEKVAKRD